VSGSAKLKVGDIVVPSASTLNNETGKIMNEYWRQLNNGIIVEVPPHVDRSTLYGVYWDIGMVDYSLERELELIPDIDID